MPYADSGADTTGSHIWTGEATTIAYSPVEAWRARSRWCIMGERRDAVHHRGIVAPQSQAPDQPTVRACLLARISPASALEGYGLVHALSSPRGAARPAPPVLPQPPHF